MSTGVSSPIYSYSAGPATEPRFGASPDEARFAQTPAFAPSPGLPPQPYYKPIMTAPPPLLPPGPIQTPAGPLAQSVPLGQPPAMGAAIPPPDQLAPCLFHTHPSHAPIPAIPSQPGGTSVYDYSYRPNMTYWGAPQQHQQQPPMAPWMPPPAAQPLPAAQQQDANKPPASPDEEKNKKPEDGELPKQMKDAPKLTPDQVQQINTDLESSDHMVRMQGAKTLAKIISADPDILSNPLYNQYAESLMLKVLKDPNSMVRQPLLLCMELGDLNQPTKPIMDALEKLKGEHGLYNFEPAIVQKIQAGFKEKEQKTAQEQQQSPDSQQQPASANQNEQQPANQNGLQGSAVAAMQPLGGTGAFQQGGMLPQQGMQRPAGSMPSALPIAGQNAPPPYPNAAGFSRTAMPTPAWPGMPINPAMPMMPNTMMVPANVHPLAANRNAQPGMTPPPAMPGQRLNMMAG